MNASNLKTFLTYAAVGAGLASGVLIWNARQKMNLLSIPAPTPAPSIFLEPHIDLKSSTTETASALSRIVQGQLDAFRANDYARAFQFAVKGIQSDFTLKDFEQMVKRDYPVIAEWKSVRFGQAVDNGSKAVLQVFIQGGEKLESEFQYNLEKEGADWKVAGVKGPVPNTRKPAGNL